MEILSSRGLPTETIPDGPARPWRTTNGSRLFLYFCGSIFTRRPTRRNRQIEISKSRTGGFRSDWLSCRNRACRISSILSDPQRLYSKYCASHLHPSLTAAGGVFPAREDKTAAEPQRQEDKEKRE